MQLWLDSEQSVIDWLEVIAQRNILQGEFDAVVLESFSSIGMAGGQALIHCLQVLGCHEHRLLYRVLGVAKLRAQLANVRHELPTLRCTAFELHTTTGS